MITNNINIIILYYIFFLYNMLNIILKPFTFYNIKVWYLNKVWVHTLQFRNTFQYSDQRN